MAKGENIFKRKDGRWEARYIKGYQLSGKIKYGFCYGKSYREAKEKVTQCKAALVSGEPESGADHRRRFTFYCDEWLRLRKGRVKESTYIKYDTALRRHIKPRLGSCYPQSFTTGLIDRFTEQLLFEAALAPKTVRDVLTVLRGVLRDTAAAFPGVIPPVEIHYPKNGRKEMRVLSREEQARLVAYLLTDMDACKFGVLLTLFTGMRIGELCALQWRSISLTEQTIRIDATLQRLRNTGEAGASRTRLVTGTPKSDTSARTIPPDGLRRPAVPQDGSPLPRGLCADRYGALHGAAGTAIPHGEMHPRVRIGGRSFSYPAAYLRHPGGGGGF